MKKVTISTEALKAINEVGKKAAKLTHGLFEQWRVTSEPIAPCISYGQVDYALAYVKPLFDWTLGSRQDAADHAKHAYWKNAHRHNLRVLKEGEDDWERCKVMKALAREKHYRRHNRRGYFERVYANTILEAQREADAELEHKRLVEAVEAEVRRKAVTEARYTTEGELEIDHPKEIVDSAIRAAHGNPNAGYLDMALYLDEFTAYEYDNFLETLEMEFLLKGAPAEESESVAD